MRVIVDEVELGCLDVPNLVQDLYDFAEEILDDADDGDEIPDGVLLIPWKRLENGGLMVFPEYVGETIGAPDLLAILALAEADVDETACPSCLGFHDDEEDEGDEDPNA